MTNEKLLEDIIVDLQENAGCKMCNHNNIWCRVCKWGNAIAIVKTWLSKIEEEEINLIEDDVLAVMER